jgi:hypothetical protein
MGQQKRFCRGCLLVGKRFLTTGAETFRTNSKLDLIKGNFVKVLYGDLVAMSLGKQFNSLCQDLSVN